VAQPESEFRRGPAAEERPPRYRKVTMKQFEAGKMKIEIHADGSTAAQAAAQAIAAALQAAPSQGMGVIFATGVSQLSVLRTVTQTPGIHWENIVGFHLDEYVGIDANHPASFRRYLKENLTDKVPLRRFYAIDGSAPDPEQVCRDYAARLQEVGPGLCLLGVGENGHLAFNDPGEAELHDPLDVKIVHLDDVSRQQQVAEGWFPSLQHVPSRAITVTIPAILRVPRLIVSVPGKRKAGIVRRMVEDPISAACPATWLRLHAGATVFLDEDAARDLNLEALQPVS
jgi:glucosamine-6-phosphate deaminase